MSDDPTDPLEAVYLMQRNIVKLDIILSIVRSLEGCDAFSQRDIDSVHAGIQEFRDVLKIAVEKARGEVRDG